MKLTYPDTKIPNVKLTASIVTGVLLFLAFWIFCTKRIDPGYVGIVVDLYGGNKGTSQIPVTTGMNFYFPMWTAILEYPTFVQTAVWTHSKDEGSPRNEEISFSSKEGLVITADVSLSYQLVAEKVPAFYVKFRSDNLNQFTHGFMRNTARDAFNEESVAYSVEELYSSKKEEFLNRTRDRMNKAINQYGVEIQQFGFIGAPRLPEAVVSSIGAKIKAIQDAIRVENEVRAVEAEAKKKIAQAEGEAKAHIAEAEGQARANRLIQESITPAMLEWRRMEQRSAAISRWDGKLPNYTGSPAPLPFIQ